MVFFIRNHAANCSVRPGLQVMAFKKVLNHQRVCLLLLVLQIQGLEP
jgi:hypothetical protein